MTATSDQLKEWFDMWAALRENRGATSASGSIHYERIGNQTHFFRHSSDGFCMVQPVAYVPTGEQNQDHKLGIQVLPHGVNEQRIGEYLKPGQFLSGYSKSKHPKEVAMFIDFMVNDPEATAILGSERGVPVNASIREQMQPKLREKSHFPIH